ncbi:MAG: hypothetical protein NTY36_07600 [Deltaproteobacteria bacterium]|nr:hypothetical protein [Deltaproteobacteria bacterium]
MKKTILVLVVLALLVPAAAFAATEFSLGGFIKLDSFWDSTQNTKNALTVIGRNNDQLYQHGLFGMTAQGSRFNFTIKGPKLWGATTTGLIEIDFDGSSDARVSNTSSYALRLRHAMFRLNWPETELMFGQYWGMFSEFVPEATGDADMMYHGWTFQRTPQIRLTQKFAGAWTIAGAICKPYDPNTANDALFDGQTLLAPGGPPVGVAGVQSASVGLPGQSSETPQLQGKLAFEQDLYGKAAFWGRPRGFVAQLNAGWQRNRYRANTVAQAFGTFGQNQYGTIAGFQDAQQNMDAWCVQGTLFIPVIPTHSANLAGTASITGEYYIGQGVSFLGAARDQDNSWFDFLGRNNVGQFMYDRKLTQQFGGFLQGQYYFTNQWFLTAIWAFNRNYGFDQGNSTALAGQTATNPYGYRFATTQDMSKLWAEYNLTLYYRPIEAIKFGLTYAYETTSYLQRVNNPNSLTGVGPNVPAQVQGQPNAGAKDLGESHRIQFVAYMFF